MDATNRMELTLGPSFFNWPIPAWSDFYARIADEAALDCVVIGEAVCSKREPFRREATVAAVERLQRAGKKVAIATLALPTAKRETDEIRELADAGMLIEANDIAAVQLMEGKPHIVGPFLNIYNEAALGFHLGLGAVRVCLPPELPLASIARMAAMCDAVEVFAFGRPPLAISARCYHARAFGLPKDACKYVCDKDPDGMKVSTIDGKDFLAVNGVQTLGHAFVAATRETKPLREAGVASLRLSPHSCDMVQVAKTFRDLADERMAPPEAEAALTALNLPGPLSDGFLRGVPGARTLAETD
jgi:O2-independent ubiquinone biosynthesis protein UbiV